MPGRNAQGARILGSSEVTAMHKLLVAALFCGALSACSGSDGKKSSDAAAGSSTATAGSAGTQTSGGGSAAGGASAQAGSAGTPTTGGASGNPDWPSYEAAEASPSSTRVLVLLLDFADSDQDTLVPNSEERWGKMIFGREQSNGNNYWYETSAGQFQLLPAAETQGTPNNGVVHVKVSENKPTTGVLVAEEQPWLPEALDKAATYVDFKSFDKDGDGILKNNELSVLFIINWEFDQIALAPAQANIALNYPIAGTGVTLEKFARDMYLHTSIGISMHELGHHILDLDHTPSPTDHDLMGQGEYWPDPKISTLHDPNWFNATRPTELKAMHKVRAGWVTPTELTGSMQGVKLNAPELGKQYNVIKLPVAQGFLLLENRTAAGYDQSIPFCAGEKGALFVDDVAQYLNPLVLTNGAAPHTESDFVETYPTLCDVYALAGHNDSFTYGGWKISNVSAPGPTMTLDIEKLAVTPSISYYMLRTFWDDAGKRIGHQIKLEGSASTFDFSKLSGGTSITGFVSLGLNAYYTTGEVRGVALDTTYTSDSPYLEIANAGKFTNGGAPTPDSLTYVTIHPDQPHVTSAKVTFKTGTLEHTITFTNLPQN
jgi:M6 family metalloprotease-like protein